MCVCFRKNKIPGQQAGGPGGTLPQSKKRHVNLSLPVIQLLITLQFFSTETKE